MTEIAFPGFSGEAVAAVTSKLNEAEAQGAHVLLAVESGSRAWGFPSPDSDYDCRFVYAWRACDHVRLVQQRDVIEFPIVGEIDASGWDLRKALLLALSGNAILIEWASSPVLYRARDGFRERLARLLQDIMDVKRVARHYLGLADAQIKRCALLDSEVRLKKLFYGVRPLIALDWMEVRDFQTLPPMNMLTCMDGANLPDDVYETILQMLALKRERREIGTGPVPIPLTRYMLARHAYHAARAYPSKNTVQRDDRYAAAGNFYRREIERLG